MKRRLSAEKPEKRSATDEEDDDTENGNSFVERERTSIVVPAYYTFANIDQLQLDSVYLVEVGIIRSSHYFHVDAKSQISDCRKCSIG